MSAKPTAAASPDDQTRRQGCHTRAGPAEEPHGFLPILYLPAGREAGGFLILPRLRSQHKLVVELTAALVKPILALHAAMAEDSDLPWPARGWRGPGRLSSAIAAQDPSLIPVEPQTIRAYLSKVSQSIRRAARNARARDVPNLFQHRRSFGVRLATDRLLVIDATSARP